MKSILKIVLIIILLIALIVLIAAAVAAIAGAATAGGAGGAAALGGAAGAGGGALATASSYAASLFAALGIPAGTALSTVALVAGGVLIAGVAVYDLAFKDGKVHKEVAQSVVRGVKGTFHAVADPLKKIAKQGTSRLGRGFSTILVAGAVVGGLLLMKKGKHNVKVKRRLVRYPKSDQS